MPWYRFEGAVDYYIGRAGGALWMWFAATLCLTLICHSQSPQSGRIDGVVYNFVTKEQIGGANVSVIGTPFGAVTDSLGEFIIRNIPPGRYRIKVSFLGYSSLVVSAVDVMPGKPQSLRCALQENPVQMEQKDIVAEYAVRSPDLPLSVESMTAEEIRHQPGGIDDVIRTASILPGVARVEVGRNDLVVRGGAPSENLYLVDGFQFPTINHFSTQGVSGGPVSFVNVDFVDKTTFSSGGYGVRYGDRMSSVFNIELRNGRTDRLGGKVDVSATQFGASAEGPIGDRGSGFLAVRRTYLDLLFKAAGLPFVPEYYDLLGKATYRLDASNDLSCVIAGALDHIRMFNDSPEDRSDNSGILGSNQNQFAGGAAWRHLFTGGYIRGAVSLSYIDYDDRQNDTFLVPIFTAKSKERELSTRLDFVTQPSKATEILLGGQLTSVNVASVAHLAFFETSFGDYIGNVEDFIDGINRNDHFQSIKTALFLQVSHNLTDRLQMTLGGRLDDFGILQAGTQPSVRFSGSYRLTPSLTVVGSIGRYYQSPAYVWLILNKYNRTLKMLRVDQVSLGFEQLFTDSWKVTVEGYLKEYGNYPTSLIRPYIVQSNTGAGYDYGFADNFASFGFDPMVSKGTGRSRGMELCVQKQFTNTPFYGMLSISVGEVRFTALDGVERPGAFDQRVVANLGAGARPNPNWEYGMKFRFATGRPYTPFKAGGSQDTLDLYIDRLPPAHSLDLRVDRYWMFSSWTLRTYLDVQNVYNRRNETYIRYNHRTQTVDMNEPIGIIPTIGIIAEF